MKYILLLTLIMVISISCAPNSEQTAYIGSDFNFDQWTGIVAFTGVRYKYWENEKTKEHFLDMMQQPEKMDTDQFLKLCMDTCKHLEVCYHINFCHDGCKTLKGKRVDGLCELLTDGIQVSKLTTLGIEPSDSKWIHYDMSFSFRKKWEEKKEERNGKE